MNPLSIVICSRDRAAPLARCLDALPADSMRESGAELVVVDNGSSDGTAGVIADFVRRAPYPVVAVSEPHAGLSRARNAGLRAATGRVIAFTDDDCVPDASFPRVAAAVFDDASFRYCGGRILLGDPNDARYCFLDDPRPRSIPSGSLLLPGEIQGANMVVHRDVVERIGGFDPMLGAGTPFRSEDIDYLARASMAGFAGAYVPELVVHHYHGRKPGREIAELKRSNDIARGAFFAKMIDLGQPGYRRPWNRSLWLPWRVPAWFRSRRGASEYRSAVRAAGVVPALEVPLGDR